MMGYLIYGFAIVGAWTVLRSIWRLCKIAVAIWRLQKTILRVKQTKKTALVEVLRNLSQPVTVTQKTWPKEEQDRAN